MGSELILLGPLTTTWTPPTSCLSTTTRWGETYRGFFMGYHSSLGIDVDCFPSFKPEETGPVTVSPLVTFTTITDPSPTLVATITGYSTFRPRPTGSQKADSLINYTGYQNRLAYYSPGLCPSGYQYAATYTGRINDYFWSTARIKLKDPDAMKYICCPSGYTIYSRETSTSRKANLKVFHTTAISYRYPECTKGTDLVTNIWTLTPGWPTIKPTSFQLSTASEKYYTYSVFASGIVVGWQTTDNVVMDLVRQGNISLPITTEMKITSSLHAGSIAGVAIGAIIGMALVLGLILCCLRSKKTKEKVDIHGTSQHSTNSVITTPSSPPLTGNSYDYPMEIDQMLPQEHLSPSEAIDDPPPKYEAKS